MLKTNLRMNRVVLAPSRPSDGVAAAPDENSAEKEKKRSKGVEVLKAEALSKHAPTEESVL